jgi:hypothetical protein
VCEECSYPNAVASLRALAQLTEFGISPAEAQELGGQAARHTLPCVSRAAGDPPPDTNEIGRWSGSVAQAADAATAAVVGHVSTTQDQAATERAMPELYSREICEEIVPPIMERQVSRLRALVAKHGVGGLPTTKGWRLIPRARTDAATTPVPGAAADEAAAAVCAAAHDTARTRAVVPAHAVVPTHAVAPP